MDGGLLLEWVLKSVFILLAMTAGFAYLTLFERRMIANSRCAWAPTAPDRLAFCSQWRMGSN